MKRFINIGVKYCDFACERADLPILVKYLISV